MNQIAVQRFFADTPPKAIHVVLLSILAAMLSITIVQLFLPEAYADTNSAGISYRSNTGTGTTQAPKYREWNAGALAWSSETVLADTGSPVRFAWIEYSPISAKRVIVTLSDDGTLNAFTCSSSCTTASNWAQQSDFADLWTTAPSGAQRPFDLEFEKTSGDLVLVYDKVSTVAAEDLFYRVMPAGSNQFGTEGSIDNSNTLLSSDTVYSFTRLSSKKTASTNDLALIALDETNSDAVAWIWNGSTDSWGSEKTITLLASIGTEELVGIAHETSSGDIIAVAGSSTSMFYCEFTGGAWCITPATFGPVAIGMINWVTIKADPVSSSNALFVAETGSSSDLDTQYWSGSAWTDHAEHDAAIDGHASRVADFGWDNTGSQGVLIWGTASGTLSYKTFSGTSTFGSASSFPETGTHPWVQLADSPNPTSGDTLSSMGATLDSTLDIGGIRWDGASSAPVSTGDGGITADTTVTTYENFKVAWQRSGSAPAWDTTMSEGLALTDGQAKNPSKRVSENLGLSDSLQIAVAFLQELNEALALADNRSFNAGRRLDETIGLSETKTFSSTRSFSENLSLVDTRTTSTLFSNSLSENLAADDIFSAATTKILLENTGLSDSSNTSSVFIRSMSENLGASDSPALSPYKSLSESLATLDQFRSDVGKSLLENIETSDALTGSADFVQGIAETIALTDLTSLATEYSKSLAESIALEDSITDVFVDIQLALGESLALVISFFTPEVGYQSSLVSEGVGLADTLQFASQYDLRLNETLASQDSILPQHHPEPEEDETDTTEDQPRSGRGGRGSGGSIPSDEPPSSVDTHPRAGRNLEFGLSETIRVQSEQSLTGVDFDRVDIDIHATLHGVSTSYQLIPPAALASVMFEIENNGNSTEHVLIEYWYVNEESGVTKFASTQEFLSAPDQTVLEAVDITLPSAGEYSVIASVKTGDNNKIHDTTSIEITVSPIDVYLNALIAISAESSASTGGYLFWVKRWRRTDKKDGAPL